MKVWMRGRCASRTASAQRSMSFSEARARPATEAFFTRRATSQTLSKSPGLAIGKAGLDDVDAQCVEEIGDLQLLLEGHRGAGRLLAVAQGGVENHDAVGVMVRRMRRRRGSVM